MKKSTRILFGLTAVLVTLTLLAGTLSPAVSASAAPAYQSAVGATPVPLSPSGIIALKKPLSTFKWSAVSGAAAYKLEVYRGTTIVYTLYPSSSYCYAGTCTFTPETSLKFLAYKWRIAVKGATTFSPFKSFIITHVPWNINDGFPGDMMLWETMAGGKWSVSDKAIYSNGLAGKYSSIYYTWSRAYANFEYESKLKVEGDPVNGKYPEAYMAIRMDNKVNPANLAWYGGYLFGYSSNGFFSIWKMNPDGSSTALIPPTYSSSIRKNGAYKNWNTLRLEALGNRFIFFINDKQVADVKDSAYSLGYIGFEMKRPGTLPATMYVDWITMKILP